MKHFIITLFAILFSAVSLFSQEKEHPISFRKEQALHAKKEQRFAPRENRGGGSLTLPFFDDFAHYTLPTDDPAIPQEWQRWADTMVYINDVMAVSPPTIGVATLDGLNGRGYPYNFVDEFSHGHADTLTSLPINLQGYTAADSIYLIFHYQGGGIANAPEEEDSLMVDFYSPFGGGQWFPKWSIPGAAADTFVRVMLPITEPEFFFDGFQFRFRNKSTLSGAWDQWHIDYVQVESDIIAAEFTYGNQVSMQYPSYTLLNEYSAMPWTHFISNPTAYMADSLKAYENNLGNTANITTRYSISYQGNTFVGPNQDNNTNNNSFREITRTLSLEGFVYDTEVNDTCAVFDVCTYIFPVDTNLDNDTTCFQQVFNDYYAYDDGSAERSYAVDALGGRMAMKYRTEVADTLLGIYVNFLPSGIDNSTQSFLLRIWDDGGSEPGAEIAENFTFHYPRYYNDEIGDYNVFSYYPFDNPVPMETGNFYVGFVQSEEIGIRVGNDKNTDNNGVKLFYSLGATNTWQQSETTGSLMLRPVFKSGKSGVWNNVTELSKEVGTIYPNPFQDQLSIPFGEENTPYLLSIIDITGRTVYSEKVISSSMFNWNLPALTNATYILQVTSQKTGNTSHQTVVRHD